MIAPVFAMVWLHVLEASIDEHGRCCVDEVDGRA
jgi:hypothetical protein